MKLLLVGHGYLGQAVARVFRESGWEVMPVSLSGGNDSIACDVGDCAGVKSLPAADFIVHCAASGRGGAEAYQHVYVDGCRNLTEVFPGVPLLFTSSTSVYAQTDGSVVTEESPAIPDRETGRLLLEAENITLDAGGMVTRLSGIYGPGRSVILKKFLSGEAVIEDDGQRFLNQIHRDDAARAISHLATTRATGVFNVSDSTPLSQLACYQALSAMFARPLPPSGPRDLNRKRGWTHKQVSNAKLRATGWQPEFPSFLDAAAGFVSRLPSFMEALRFWWKLGWISFGGPAGQITIMHKEIVERRRWLSEDHFLHALNFCMLLPGPEAQQLATYLGWRLHGARGGIAAGALFVLPSVFILFALSWIYMAGGDIVWIQGIFYGLTAAVIAIVVTAVKRIGSKALKTQSLWVLAAAAFVAIFILKISFVIIILSAALIGFVGGKFVPKQFPAGKGHGKSHGEELPCVELPPAHTASVGRTILVSTLCLTLWWLPVLAAGWVLGWRSIQFQEGLFFSKAALVTIGGAYAVLPYVSQMAVEHYGWLGQKQMMAGLGLAETTPGPLIMVLQFVGFVAAWQNPGNLSPLLAGTLGALITTWVTFLPCFLFVFLGAPHVEGLRERPALASTLTAITAAVVGVILNLAIWFAWHALRPEGGTFDYFVAVIAIGSWLAMERFKIGVIPTLAVCAVIGILVKIVGAA